MFTIKQLIQYKEVKKKRKENIKKKNNSIEKKFTLHSIIYCKYNTPVENFKVRDIYTTHMLTVNYMEWIYGLN